MVKYVTADIWIEIICSFFVALAWLLLIISINRTAEDSQRKKSKLRIPYLLMTGSLANIGCFVSFYAWLFDVRGITETLLHKNGQELKSSLATYIYLQAVFKFIRDVCTYSAEVSFVFQYYAVSFRIKRIMNGGSNHMTKESVRKIRILKGSFLILMVGI
jgi:hypothetical protein